MDIFAFSAGFLTPCAVVSRKPSYTYVTLRPFFKWKLKNTPIYKCNPDFKKKSGRCGKHKLSDHLLILFHIHPTEKQQNDDIFNVLPQQLDWLLIFVFLFFNMCLFWIWWTFLKSLGRKRLAKLLNCSRNTSIPHTTIQPVQKVWQWFKLYYNYWYSLI